MAEDDVAVAIQQEPVSLKLRLTQRSDGSPSHKRVRLSLSPAPVSGAADQHRSPLATAVPTATPDLFDATPGEATGVQPGRRKSSRSRRAMVLALDGKLTKEAYKYKVSDLLAWTSTMLNANNVKSCTEKEMLAVLQIRDSEECVMLSAQDGADVAYIM
ncbi:hypothetical protein WJX82_000816 [Trebouxia sp. C0006]